MGRRGWTDFAGGRFQSGAYAFDLAKLGLLNGQDRLGLRLSQPLRIERGGVAMMLPTSYDYATGLATEDEAQGATGTPHPAVPATLYVRRTHCGSVETRGFR